jgi:hypothetical protein
MVAFIQQQQHQIDHERAAQPFAANNIYSVHNALIERAAALLGAGQPDRAALLLDGLAQQIAAGWFQQQGEPAPDSLYLLVALEERVPALAWQLRLALRAPSVETRLVHCQHLLASVSSPSNVAAQP